jgi:16S rRNA processing protein RimM
MVEYFKMGVITSPHGIQGEVKVFPTTDNVQHFKNISDCYLKKGKEYKPAKITGCKFFKGMVIVHLEGFDDRDEVEKLRRVEIYVDRANADPLEEGEYYMADIIGYDLYNIDAETETDVENFNPDNTVLVGKIKDYIDTAVHPVIMAEDTEGKERLVPAIHQFVKKVDHDAERVYVCLIKGM